MWFCLYFNTHFLSFHFLSVVKLTDFGSHSYFTNLCVYKELKSFIFVRIGAKKVSGCVTQNHFESLICLQDKRAKKMSSFLENHLKQESCCTAERDTVCVCERGFYCSTPVCDHCQPVTRCSKGSGVKVPGRFPLSCQYKTIIQEDSNLNRMFPLFQQLAQTTQYAKRVKREPTAM